MGTKDSNHDVLTVLVSFILDVFSLYWTTYEADGRYGSTASQPMLSQGKIIEENVRRVLAKQGFEEVPAIWYNEPLSGIELDVTLGKCLFDDYDG